jgi:integrase
MVKVREYRRRGKPSGSWEVDVRLDLPSGGRYRERVKVAVTGRTNARRWALDREAEVLALARQGLDAVAIRARLQGREVNEDKMEIPTLETFKARFAREHLVAERRKPSSIAAVESIYREHLAPILGAKPVDAITEADVQVLKARLAGKSPKTTNNVLAVLGSMLRRAAEWGVIERVPRVRFLRVPLSTPPFYDFAEYRRLVEAAGKVDHRVEVVVLLGGDAGLRRGEMLALEWTDLDFPRHTIHVQRSEWNGQVTAPKGGRSRRVPMTERLAEALRAHRHLRGPRVVYGEDGATPTNKVVRLWMEAAERRAMLPTKGRIHVLRHTFCSHLAMQGAPAKAIQELAGHTTLAMTARYMHLSPAAKDAAIRLLDQRPDGEGVEARMEAHSAAEAKPSGLQ